MEKKLTRSTFGEILETYYFKVIRNLVTIPKTHIIVKYGYLPLKGIGEYRDGNGPK
jgi:hypothetical protein